MCRCDTQGSEGRPQHLEWRGEIEGCQDVMRPFCEHCMIDDDSTEGCKLFDIECHPVHKYKCSGDYDLVNADDNNMCTDLNEIDYTNGRIVIDATGDVARAILKSSEDCSNQSNDANLYQFNH
jgi:hypothetical protein